MKWIVLPALSLWGFAFAQVSNDPIQQKLDEVQTLDRTGRKPDTDKAAGILKSIKRAELSEDQFETWLRYSRDVAVRSGDVVWLTELSKIESPFDWDKVFVVNLAYGKLTKGDIKSAEKLLDSLDPESINLRDGRRIYGLRARIAHLKKDPKAELVQVEKMIDHLPYWPEKRCQTCHDSSGKMTSLPIKSLWFGERYSELLMVSKGAASKVVADSQRSLKDNPEDNLAKIRLGYALRALGRGAEAEAVLDSVPFSDAEKNNLPKPRMFFAYP